MYIYPDNLKSKAVLWLWQLRDIGIIGIGCLISVFALAHVVYLRKIRMLQRRQYALPN